MYTHMLYLTITLFSHLHADTFLLIPNYLNDIIKWVQNEIHRRNEIIKFQTSLPVRSLRRKHHLTRPTDKCEHVNARFVLNKWIKLKYSPSTYARLWFIKTIFHTAICFSFTFASRSFFKSQLNIYVTPGAWVVPKLFPVPYSNGAWRGDLEKKPEMFYQPVSTRPSSK